MNLINKNTKLIISIAKKPGNFGNLFHNFFYNKKKINYLYLSRKLDKIDYLKEFIFNFDIKGCSVSMPFKNQVVELLDKQDKFVKLTGSSNTILNKRGKLIGYNTDYYALNNVLKQLNIKKNFIILIIGSGSMAYLSYLLLRAKSNHIHIMSRNTNRFKNWKHEHFSYMKWGKIRNLKPHIIINATSLGMDNSNIKVFLNKNFKQTKYIIDYVVNSKNELKNLSKKFDIKYISGKKLTLMQAKKQFQIYTGKKLKEMDLIKFKNDYE